MWFLCIESRDLSLEGHLEYQEFAYPDYIFSSSERLSTIPIKEWSKSRLYKRSTLHIINWLIINSKHTMVNK